MSYITREDLSPVDKPDCSCPSRPGGHPDYVFEDSRNRRYTLELTRLLTPKLRALEMAVRKKVSEHVEHMLPGTYGLHVRVADSLGRGKVAAKLLTQAKEEIEQLVSDGRLQDSQQLASGFVLWKANHEGNKLVPWVTAPELPYDLNDSHPSAKDLKKHIDAIVDEAQQKFHGYDPIRVLVIATSQSGLDLEFHAGISKEGKGILLRWLDDLSPQITNLDAVFLDPGIRVWSNGGMVLAGHKYTESKAGYYIEAWRRPGVARLLI